MQIPLGDLSDRLSVATRKRRIQAGSVADVEIEELLNAVFEIYDRLDEKHKKIFFLHLTELCDLNNAIWHLEFDIRTAKETELDLEIVGRRALEIRELNRQRVAIRSRMNDYSGTGHRIVNV
jgi:hypothetical protein